MHNKKLIEEFYERVWNNRDVEYIPNLFVERCTFKGSIGKETRGYKGIEEYVVLITNALGNYRCKIQQVISENNKAYAKVEFSGIHKGELMGYTPSGKKLTWLGAAEFQFEEGKISSVWVLGDVFGLVQQLNANNT